MTTLDARGIIAKEYLDALRDQGVLARLEFLGFELHYQLDAYYNAQPVYHHDQMLPQLPKQLIVDLDLLAWRVGAIGGAACYVHPVHPPVFTTTLSPAMESQ